MSSAAKFNAEVQSWFEKNVVKRPLEVQRIAILEALTQAVQTTPVGNEKNWKINADRVDENGNRRVGVKLYKRKGYVGGHARRNWQISFGAPNRQKVEGVDRSGARTLSDGARVARSIKNLGITYLTNNVVYIDVIDKGKPGTQPLYKPWSKQAPQGLLQPIINGVMKRLADIAFKRDNPL